jgi:hypothetical protein
MKVELTVVMEVDAQGDPTHEEILKGAVKITKYYLHDEDLLVQQDVEDDQSAMTGDEDSIKVSGRILET